MTIAGCSKTVACAGMACVLLALIDAGTVYKCKHKLTGEIVAIKQLRDDANEQVWHQRRGTQSKNHVNMLRS